MKNFIIMDWAGNIIPTKNFNSFEDAEDFLCEKLGENYDEDRQEYYIEETEES